MKGLEELLWGVERCWAYAMELRHADEHRKRLHAIERWKRAIQLSARLIQYIKTHHGGSSMLLTEAESYELWMQAQLAIESRKDYAEALKALSACRSLLVKLASTSNHCALVHNRIEEVAIWRGFLENKLSKEQSGSIAFDETPIVMQGVASISLKEGPVPAAGNGSVEEAKSKLIALFTKWDTYSLQFHEVSQQAKAIPLPDALKKSLKDTLEAVRLMAQFNASPIDPLSKAYFPGLGEKARADTFKQMLVRIGKSRAKGGSLLLNSKILDKLRTLEILYQITHQIALRDYAEATRTFEANSAAIKSCYPVRFRVFSEALSKIEDAEASLAENGYRMTGLGPVPINGITNLMHASTEFIPAPLQPSQPQLLPVKPIFYDIAFDHLTSPTF